MSEVIQSTVSDTVGRVMGAGLKAKSFRAVMKLSAGAGVGYGLKFARGMILARLLAPSDIGLMAIIMSFSMAFEALTEIGIKSAVIRSRQGAEADCLNVAWWFQVIRGFLLFCLAIFAAPWISSFYDRVELLNLLRVSSLAILFRGLVSPRAYVLEKEYRFGSSVMLNQGSAALGVITTIILVFMIRNVWGLVIGFVAETAILSLASFIFVPIVPRFKVDRQNLVELMSFARGMFGLPILTFVSNQAPILVLGKVISDDQLGLYSYASLLAYFPIMMYSNMVEPILLPAFSQRQDDHVALRRGLLLVTRWTAAFGIPVAAYMACCSGELLSIIYKPAYAAMAVPFAILCVRIVAWTEVGVLATLYFAVGQPRLHRHCSIASAVAVIALVYPASVYLGTVGAAGVVVASNLLLLFLQIVGCHRIIGLKFRSYARCYLTGLVLAVPIVLTFELLWLLRIVNPTLVIVIGTFVFVATLAIDLFVMIRSKRTGRDYGEDRRPA